MECEVADSFSFKNGRGLKLYDQFLNMDENQSTNWMRTLNLISTYRGTFKENDPYRVMAAGQNASAAAFQDKLDGGNFIDNRCIFRPESTSLNVESINYYDYTLDTLQTKIIKGSPPKKRQTIYEKKYTTPGKIITRNTLSTKFSIVENALPAMSTYPTISGKVIDFEVIYDTFVAYTVDSIYLERIGYDYNSGEATVSSTAPILIPSYTEPTSKVSRGYFNESTGVFTFARTKSIQYNQGLLPEIFQYNINTGNYKLVYSEDLATQKDIESLLLPGRMRTDFNITHVGAPVMCYNDILQRYTVVCDVNLRSTYTGSVTGEHAEKVFCLMLFNFNMTQSGLKYLNSIIYHPKNKREFRYDSSIEKTTVELLSGQEIINLGTPVAANPQITIDPINLPVRESKLKEIIYRYDGKTEIVSRPAVNDPAIVGLSDISRLREGYIPLSGGGTIDWACPKYQKTIIVPDTNVEDVSLITIEVEAVYFDGFRLNFKILGEARPRPVDYTFKNLRLIDCVSYTTTRAQNLVRVVLETQQPVHLLEYIIDNTTDVASVEYKSYDLETPVMSTTSLSGLSSLSGMFDNIPQ